MGKAVTLSEVLSEMLMMVGLSFIAILALVFFFDFIEEYGEIQTFFIFLLHAAFFAGLLYSQKKKTAKYAIYSVYLLMAWNVILVFAVMKGMSDSYFIDSKAVAQFLVGDAIAMFYCFRYIKKLKKAEALSSAEAAPQQA